MTLSDYEMMRNILMVSLDGALDEIFAADVSLGVSADISIQLADVCAVMLSVASESYDLGAESAGK